ncbi:Uncharacterised protein [Salmonella enterica subsp. enterica]|uniref:Uncharacterized protein n=1 Tax=Salmonella enterica I TaxID=59201 RepID=A0A3S4JAZ4_SALET|nr:Uncharacterised protein [Salmonella enterica subsp. enterica]
MTQQEYQRRRQALLAQMQARQRRADLCRAGGDAQRRQ